MSAHAEAEKRRLDKWLWYARLCKTRTFAAGLCAKGLVTLEGQTVKPSQMVRIGSVVTLIHGGWQRGLVVLALGDRRGPALEAAGLYREIERIRDGIPEPPWERLLLDETDLRHDFARSVEDTGG